MGALDEVMCPRGPSYRLLLRRASVNFVGPSPKQFYAGPSLRSSFFWVEGGGEEGREACKMISSFCSAPSLAK